MKLDELDSLMCDIVGTVQQLEYDVLAIDVVSDDPVTLEAKISNMQVLQFISISLFHQTCLLISLYPIDSAYFIADLLEKF